jgi:hypothetical protein
VDLTNFLQAHGFSEVHKNLISTKAFVGVSEGTEDLKAATMCAALDRLP